MEGVTKSHLDQIAKRTDGFSGRAMSKFMLNLQGAVYAEPDCKLTVQLLQKVTARELEKHAARTSDSGDWLSSGSSPSESRLTS